MIEPAAVSEEDFTRFIGTTYAAAVADAGRRAEARTAASAAVSRRRRSAQAEGGPGGDAGSAAVGDDPRAAGHRGSGGDGRRDQAGSDDRLARTRPIVKLANSVLGLAIKQGASDIHIEPMEGDVTLRYRIDGVLQVVQRLPKRVQMGLDLAPQDSEPARYRGEAPAAGRPLLRDARRQADRLPRVHGAGQVGREGRAAHPRQEQHAARARQADYRSRPTLALVREMIQQPYGIVYVTGPDGLRQDDDALFGAGGDQRSRRQHLHRRGSDRVRPPGVTQIQANASIDLTFASILRAFLRQDPDVILVGETRDKETAHTAVEAALTGHLVFTTLHTNSAAVAFSRLSEMGIEPFLVSSSTIGVVAQRLARRLCQTCTRAVRRRIAETRALLRSAPTARGCTAAAAARSCARQRCEGARRDLRSDADDAGAAADGRAAAPPPKRSTPRRWPAAWSISRPTRRCLLVQGLTSTERSPASFPWRESVSAYDGSAVRTIRVNPSKHPANTQFFEALPLLFVPASGSAGGSVECEDLERSRSRWRAH